MKNTALLVIDLQREVLEQPGTWDPEGVIARAAELADKARKAGAPVIWVQDNEDMPIGSPQWQLAEGLDPEPSDFRVDKEYGDSFEETDLGAILEERGVRRLVVCGAQSDACIRSTVHGALVRGYDVTLASDAHTTGEFPAEFSDGEAIPARTKINFTNMYVQWGTEYPGRSGTTAASADIEF
ncbi:cysteine hydrolase family protein [Actinomycetaceae bacterium L2_0104]